MSNRPTVDGNLLARKFANVALASLSYFVLALIALHFLRPDYAPRSHFISDYAVGEYGWVMTSAFLALSTACFTLMIGMMMAGPKSIVGRLGAGLLMVATIGLIVTAIYKTDLPGAPYTRSGDIHELTFRINTASLIFGALLMSIGFGSSENWRSYRKPALLMFALIAIAMFIQIKTLHKNAPYGYANRFFVVTLITWLVVTSIRLRSICAAESMPLHSSASGQSQ